MLVPSQKFVEPEMAESTTEEHRRSVVPIASPTIDVVVPVHNEGAGLAQSIERLHEYLSAGFPFSWRITIADNASTDATLSIARALSQRLANVRVLHLEQKGRGLALRTAWTHNDAAVVAYMDVDLSTGLDALLPLVAPLVSGHSDIAIGSRLSAGANVARGPKREVISRIYNLILRLVFSTRIRDAQCGFKAVRSDVAARLLPAVEDNAWFFDSELLLIAEHNGLRVHEVPVDWVDDPDSRVDVGRTAIEDLKGVLRLSVRFVVGRGQINLAAGTRRSVRDDMGRRFVPFALVGLTSTLISLLVYVWLRSRLSPQWSVMLALGITSIANSWAHRRWTLGRRGRRGLGRHLTLLIIVGLATVIASVVVLTVVGAAGGGLPAELASLAVVWSLAAVVRFAVISRVLDTPEPELHDDHRN